MQPPNSIKTQVSQTGNSYNEWLIKGFEQDADSLFSRDSYTDAIDQYQHALQLIISTITEKKELKDTLLPSHTKIAFRLARCNMSLGNMSAMSRYIQIGFTGYDAIKDSPLKEKCKEIILWVFSDFTSIEKVRSLGNSTKNINERAQKEIERVLKILSNPLCTPESLRDYFLEMINRKIAPKELNENCYKFLLHFPFDDENRMGIYLKWLNKFPNPDFSPGDRSFIDMYLGDSNLDGGILFAYVKIKNIPIATRLDFLEGKLKRRVGKEDFPRLCVLFFEIYEEHHQKDIKSPSSAFTYLLNKVKNGGGDLRFCISFIKAFQVYVSTARPEVIDNLIDHLILMYGNFIQFHIEKNDQSQHFLRELKSCLLELENLLPKIRSNGQDVILYTSRKVYQFLGRLKDLSKEAKLIIQSFMNLSKKPIVSGLVSKSNNLAMERSLELQRQIDEFSKRAESLESSLAAGNDLASQLPTPFHPLHHFYMPPESQFGSPFSQGPQSQSSFLQSAFSNEQQSNDFENDLNSGSSSSTGSSTSESTIPSSDPLMDFVPNGSFDDPSRSTSDTTSIMSLSTISSGIVSKFSSNIVQEEIKGFTPLVNSGTTCFLNSIFQMIMNHKELAEAINKAIKLQKDQELDPKKKGALEYFNVAYEKYNKGDKDINLDNLRPLMQENDSWGQQDATAFRIALMRYLSSAKEQEFCFKLGIDRSYMPYDTSKDVEQAQRLASYKSKKNDVNQLNEENLVRNKSEFDFQFMIDVTSDFVDIQVELNNLFKYKKGTESSPTILKDSKGQYQCYMLSQQKLRMETTPEWFSISLNLLGYEDGQTIKKEVTIYPYLELTLNGKEYELIRFCTHYGEASMGHYNAYIKNGRDWICCDDKRISRVTDDGINDEIQKFYFGDYRLKGSSAKKVHDSDEKKHEGD